jgi:hypothetical protein
MDPDEREATLGTFTSVTSCDPGTSRAILEHYKWDLDRAVDAFFDGSWQNALIDAKEAADLAASGASPGSPPVAALGGVQDLTAERTTTIDDDDDDDDYVPSPPGFADADASAGGVVERGLGGDYHYVEDDDMEDQMLSAAVAASEDDARRFHLSGRDPSAPITLDDDDEDVQRAIRESVGGARADDRDHERDNRPPPAPPARARLRRRLRARRGAGTRVRTVRKHQARREGHPEPPSGGGGGGCAGGGLGATRRRSPRGSPQAEREEARMLEAAIAGGAVQGPRARRGVRVRTFGVRRRRLRRRPRFLGGADRGGGGGARDPHGHGLGVRGEFAFGSREGGAAGAGEGGAGAGGGRRRRRARREEQAAREEAARAREAAIKTASDALPEEPAAGAEGVVDVAVKLPDGRAGAKAVHEDAPAAVGV